MKRTDLPRICLLGILIGCHYGWAYARGGQVQNRELTPSATSIHESWEHDYAYLQQLITKRGGYAGLYTPDTETPNVANPHSRIWTSDRTPLDVQLRRTEAVLERIGTMVSHTSQVGKALREFEQQFQRLARTAATISLAHGEDASGAEKDLYIKLRKLSRKIVLSNPLLNFDDIIFNRWTSSYGHVQECWGSTALNEGGLYVTSGIRSGRPRLRNVLENSHFTNGQWKGQRILGLGKAIRSFDLSYDGTKVVFAWVHRRLRKHRIASVNTDGSELRLLTHGEYEDLDPVWLPNGRIAFVSTRPEITVRCNNSDTTRQCVMYSMKADGSDMVRMSFHETNERYPTVDNDGMLIYMRWDYIDRDFSAAHSLWRCFPDGRDPRSPHGNYPFPHGSWSTSVDGRGDRPFAEYFMRAIPGSNKYIAIASTHHSPPYGTPILINTGVRDDNRLSQVEVITPDCLPFASECGKYTKRGLYQGIRFLPIRRECAYFDPWPLSEAFFLTPWGIISDKQERALQEKDNETNMRLYLLDIFGNRELISHCDLAGGGHYLTARPLRARPNPPTHPAGTWQGERKNTASHKRATIGVANVRQTDFDWPEDVTIKRMRLVQIFPRKWRVGDIEKPSTGWSEGGICRASLGTVPVEEDGSVYCEAPVNKVLLFQLLDEDGVAVQTMRSLTYVHPGEQLTCAGCHEDKWQAMPTGTAMPTAFQRDPSPLEPDAGGVVPMTFGFVRPVFERVCVDCHRDQDVALTDYAYNRDVPTFPDPGQTNRLSDYAWWFDSSNNNDGLGPYGGYRSTPYRFGFNESRIGKALKNPTHQNALKSGAYTQKDLDRIILWLDLNAMRLARPTKDEQELRRQEFGGEFIWPDEIDRHNPTGVEYHRAKP
ncbi:MAG: PD40 domain-containing protein [Phycisphaeraceae bacterium]|nr:PD40 domain-containing protein [Phycisphaeraceae bacterium]